jgi:hypothetical protein
LDAVIDNIVVVQLDKLTAKHVLPGFTDRSFEERQIEELTTEITQVCPLHSSLVNLNIQLGVNTQVCDY